MDRSESTRRRFFSLPALGGGLAALVVDALYLAAIAEQGMQPPGGRVTFVATWIAAAALLAIIGSGTAPPRSRALVLGASAAAFVALGVPAIWSAGMPLLLCAAAVGIGSAKAAEDAELPGVVGLATPVVLVAVAGLGVAVGFAMTGL